MNPVGTSRWKYCKVGAWDRVRVEACEEEAGRLIVSVDLNRNSYRSRRPSRNHMEGIEGIGAIDWKVQRLT